jgi:hypothetical protein
VNEFGLNDATHLPFCKSKDFWVISATFNVVQFHTPEFTIETAKIYKLSFREKASFCTLLIQFSIDQHITFAATFTSQADDKTVLFVHAETDG